MNWDYLAGLVDGEGSFSLVRRERGYLRAIMSITNTNEELMDTVYRFLVKVGTRPYFYTRYNRPPRRVCYYVSLNGLDLHKVLPRIVDTLIAKREQCRVLIEFLDGRGFDRPSMYKDIDSRRANEEYLRGYILWLNDGEP